MVALPRRARALPTLLAALLFLFAIWSVLWLFLQNRANAAVDGWLAAEAAHGRQWTCPGRSLGGYPIALALHCGKPTFRGEVAGRTSDGALEAVDAEIRLDRPRRLVIVARGPMNLRSEADDYDFAASWADLLVTIDNVGSLGARGALSASRLAVTLQTPGRGDLNLRVATVAGDAGRTAPTSSDAAFGSAPDGGAPEGSAGSPSKWRVRDTLPAAAAARSRTSFDSVTTSNPQPMARAAYSGAPQWSAALMPAP